MPNYIKDNEFSLWRAVFAFALVDGILSLEEQRVLEHHLQGVRFSPDQMQMLQEDMRLPQDVERLYNRIKDDTLRQRFCELARTLVWCDGDIERQEQEILRRLSCLGRPENRDILSNSARSDFMRAFTKSYEDIAFMPLKPVHNLFETSA